MRKIVKIVDDPDSYRVIHMEGGFAFGCGKEFMDIQQPVVGDYVVDEDWPSPSKPEYIYRRKIVKATKP